MIGDIIARSAQILTKQGDVSGFHLPPRTPPSLRIFSLLPSEKGGGEEGMAYLQHYFVPPQLWTLLHTSSGWRPGGCSCPSVCLSVLTSTLLSVLPRGGESEDF